MNNIPFYDRNFSSIYFVINLLIDKTNENFTFVYMWAYYMTNEKELALGF